MKSESDEIPGPTRPTTHPDRHLDCEEAIEARFQAVTSPRLPPRLARPETAVALINLAENHALTIEANDELAEFGAGVFPKSPRLH
ncbi:hypothetical protein ABIA14_004450 [Sinorhizobium fredii]